MILYCKKNFRASESFNTSFISKWLEWQYEKEKWLHFNFLFHCVMFCVKLLNEMRSWIRKIQCLMSTLYLSNGSKTINDMIHFCAIKIMNYIDDQNFNCRLFPFIVLVILCSRISVWNTSLYVTNYVISSGIHLSFHVESLCPWKGSHS